MDIGLRLLILAIGLALMAGYYFLVVKPRQHHRGYSPRVRNPGMFTPKPQVPSYPQEEFDPGDVIVTRRLGPDGEEVASQEPQAQKRPMRHAGYAEQRNSTPVVDDFDSDFEFDHYDAPAPTPAAAEAPKPKPRRPLNLAKEPVKTPVVDPNQRSPYDIAAEKAAAKKAELERATEDLLKDRGAYQSPNTGADQSFDSSPFEPDTSLPMDNAANNYDSNELDKYDSSFSRSEPQAEEPEEDFAPMSAVDEVRVDSSRTGRRFSHRAQKFASPQRQKKKSVDTVIPDDAKGTSQGKLSYSPVSPVTANESEDNQDIGGATEAENTQAENLETPKKMVVITLHPQVDNTVFRGNEIRSLMETFSLTLSSKTGFFECMDGIAFSGKTETIFSVGHLRGNGRFERTKLPSIETSGLIFFMTIPGPVNAADAIDMMFSIGAKAAKMLNAKLCDQKKTKLTVEQMINIRDEAVSFEKALMDQNLL